MGARLREIRRRIRSVQSTMKITRAMEQIALARIARAQRRVEAVRPYASRLAEAMADVARQTGALDHPLLEDRPEPTRAGVLVLTSDRGLAGAYNANVIRRAERLMGRLRGEGIEPVLYVVGRKGQSYFRFRQVPVERGWADFSEVPEYRHADEVAGVLMGAFREGKVDQVHAAFTDFGRRSRSGRSIGSCCRFPRPRSPAATSEDPPRITCSSRGRRRSWTGSCPST
jgi:F-type H+-transporting ATPase subunit gamma